MHLCTTCSFGLVRNISETNINGKKYGVIDSFCILVVNSDNLNRAYVHEGGIPELPQLVKECTLYTQREVPEEQIEPEIENI